MAQKTGEYRAGIARLLAAQPPVPELVAPYLQLVEAANPSGVLRYYPGSPALARAVLRAQDRLDLVELHGTDHATLAGWAESAGSGPPGGWPCRPGERMPPRERRGVILIDPSYELKSDYQAVPGALARAYRRFATGTFLLWYPVIDRTRAESCWPPCAQAASTDSSAWNLGSARRIGQGNDRCRAGGGQSALDSAGSRSRGSALDRRRP